MPRRRINIFRNFPFEWLRGAGFVLLQTRRAAGAGEVECGVQRATLFD